MPSSGSRADQRHSEISGHGVATGLETSGPLLVKLKILSVRHHLDQSRLQPTRQGLVLHAHRQCIPAWPHGRRLALDCPFGARDQLVRHRGRQQRVVDIALRDHLHRLTGIGREFRRQFRL